MPHAFIHTYHTKSSCQHQQRQSLSEKNTSIPVKIRNKNWTELSAVSTLQNCAIPSIQTIWAPHRPRHNAMVIQYLIFFIFIDIDCSSFFSSCVPTKKFFFTSTHPILLLQILQKMRWNEVRLLLSIPCNQTEQTFNTFLFYFLPLSKPIHLCSLSALLSFPSIHLISTSLLLTQSNLQVTTTTIQSTKLTLHLSPFFSLVS